MVVAAALPLVAEYGAVVTTAQIARAAGIGEATIFRVFADKDAVLDAVVTEALDDSRVREELSAIPLDQPLDARLVDAVDAIRAHHDRIGTVIAALHASGHRRGRRDLAPDAGDRRTASRDAVREAVDELFAPDAERLRLPVPALTDTFLAQLFGRDRRHTDPPMTPEDLVDLFLHGAVTR
jgi:AcrR family transcriptional regulator